MEDYKDYSNKQTEEFQKYLNQQLSVYKKDLRLGLNSSMLQHIKHAEEETEKAKEFYTKEYNENMLKIEERRRVSESSILNRKEVFIKKTFKNGLASVIKMWLSYIKDCESKIKQ